MVGKKKLFNKAQRATAKEECLPIVRGGVKKED